MFDAFLDTKLHIPKLPKNHIFRPHLIEQLKAGLEGELTLVSAPPGYGKSCLLSEFARQYAGPLLWYTIETHDNDRDTFFQSFVSALDRLFPDHEQDPVPINTSPEEKIAYLMERIAQFSSPLVVILDDFHLLSEPKFLKVLATLAEKIPPMLRLVISSRVDPPFRLSLMRARNQLTEIRTLDLAFTSQNIIDFFSAAHKFRLDEPEAMELARLTDGWPASLQMASISVSQQHDLTKLLEGLQGNNRFILDFLLEEVLCHQPEYIQEFLYATAILRKMTAELCDWLMAGKEDPPTEQISSRDILEKLEENNLFLIPLDNRRTWYRYHHLFAELLRLHDRQKLTRNIKQLHHQASVWFEEHDMIREAVYHALLSDNPQRIETTLEKNAILMIYSGELTKLAEWVSAVPEEVLHSKPWLMIAKAWLVTATGKTNQVEPLLNEIEVLSQKDLSPVIQEKITLHLTTMRYYLQVLGGNLQTIETHLKACEALLSDQDAVLHAFILNMFTTSLRMHGQILHAEEIAHKALFISKRSHDLNIILDSYLRLAQVYLDRGELHRAADTCKKAIRLAEQNDFGENVSSFVSLGNLYALYSEVLWEWNLVENGLAYARKGAELSRQWGQPNSIAYTFFILAKLYQANGRFTEAAEAVQTAYQVSEKISSRYNARKSRQIAMFQFAQDDLIGAARWIEGLPETIFENISPTFLQDYTGITKIWLAQQKNQEAFEFLQKWLPIAHQSNMELRILEGEILKTIALWQLGEKQKALEEFEAVLKRAEPMGCIRTFLILGKPPVEAMLRLCYQKNIHKGYVKSILQAFYPFEVVEELISSPAEMKADVSILSERELEVLYYLQTNLTLGEIAGELHVSHHTIRSHAKNIYAKLDVNRRSMAVQQGKNLGLI